MVTLGVWAPGLQESLLHRKQMIQNLSAVRSGTETHIRVLLYEFLLYNLKVIFSTLGTNLNTSEGPCKQGACSVLAAPTSRPSLAGQMAPLLSKSSSGEKGS